MKSWKVAPVSIVISVRTHDENWRMAERMFVKFDTAEFSNVFGQNSISVKTGKRGGHVTSGCACVLARIWSVTA
jgi:hypothetical protein